MLLEIYLLFQILTVVGLIAIFYTDTPLVAALTMLTSGVLAVGAWILDVGTKYVWNSETNAYVHETVLINTPYLAVINIAVFGLATVYFIYDIFQIAQKESPKLDNVVSGGKGEQKDKGGF